MLTKMKNRKREGFTLIELMIVVAILGILAALAISQFAAYKQRAYDAAARTQLKNLATAQEDYFIQNSVYATVAATSGDIAAFPSWGADPNVTVATTGDIDSFTATAVHSKTGNTITYDSEAGGVQ
jgi:type IV pilus assembly protein PilA